MALSDDKVRGERAGREVAERNAQRWVVIRLEGTADGVPTPADGQYLAEYDPDRDGVHPIDGRPTICHLVSTPDPDKAKRFANVIEAMNEWRRVSKHRPLRPDGLPNRPLTAFSIGFYTPECRT